MKSKILLAVLFLSTNSVVLAATQQTSGAAVLPGPQTSIATAPDFTKAVTEAEAKVFFTLSDAELVKFDDATAFPTKPGRLLSYKIRAQWNQSEIGKLYAKVKAAKKAAKKGPKSVALAKAPPPPPPQHTASPLPPPQDLGTAAPAIVPPPAPAASAAVGDGDGENDDEEETVAAAPAPAAPAATASAVAPAVNASAPAPIPPAKQLQPQQAAPKKTTPAQTPEVKTNETPAWVYPTVAVGSIFGLATVYYYLVKYLDKRAAKVKAAKKAGSKKIAPVASKA